MPTNRKRIERARIGDASNTALFYASDGFYGDPEQLDDWEKLTYAYPTVRPNECREVWLAIRDTLLPEWIKDHAGCRPSWWYLFDPDCPRISPEDVERLGWVGCYWLEHTPDLRRRLDGKGIPDCERLALVPDLSCGIPTGWIEDSIDAENPPRYESEAAYLKRHHLLTASEKRRLKPKDFRPEVVLPADEQDSRDEAVGT